MAARPFSGGPKPQLSIRVDHVTKAKLQILADAENRELSEYARIVLERHVSEVEAALVAIAEGKEPKEKIRRMLAFALHSLDDAPRTTALHGELMAAETTISADVPGTLKSDRPTIYDERKRERKRKTG